MDDVELQRFSERLGPPDEFVDKVKHIIETKIFRWLREKSKYSIDRCVLAGGLAKKTSTLLKCDADVAIFHNESSVEKETILDDFQDILMLSTDLAEDKIEINRKGTIQFNLDGIWFDVVTAKNNSDPQDRDKIRSQRVNALKHLKNSGEEKIIHDTTESSVEFIKTKSKFVHDVVRLVKYWNQLCFYGGKIHGRSLLFELLGTKAAQDEEYSIKANEDVDSSPSIGNALKIFFNLLLNLRSQKIVFSEYYDRSDIPSEILNEKPILMDPVKLIFLLIPLQAMLQRH